MGKGRNRRRNRRRKGTDVRGQFRSQSMAQTFESEMEREKYKEEQKEHLKIIEERKRDLLGRTVVVGSVLPLGEEKNRNALKRFMEDKYGPVQKLGVDKKGRGKFPRGRVTFSYKRDAEKIFGGVSLIEVSKERRQERVPCASVGHKGVITVRPSPEYKGMAKDDLNTKSSIQINTDNLCLGHWFPQGSDACANVPGLENIENDHGTWVEENPTMLNPIVKIDMERALIELDVTHCDGVEYITSSEKRIVLSFRFKDLAHPMELCRSERSILGSILGREMFCVAFSLKHPPRLSSIEINHETGWESRTRLTDIVHGNSSVIPGVGLCLGYQLQVSTVEINRMLKARAFDKLKKMGVFRCEDELDLPRQAELIHKKQVSGSDKMTLDRKIKSIPLYRTRFLVTCLLDGHSCSWFDMLNDRVDGLTFIDLVKGGEVDLVERILNEMKNLNGSATRYPARMFHALYGAGAEVDEAPRDVPEFCVSLPRILITPCRLCATGFEVEMSNRIVRKFVERHDFSDDSFIRVSIGNENGDKLFSDDLSQQVEDRIKILVLEGINVANKKYQFLAFSSSQLKEQSLWMVCPKRGWDITSMRASMGDFSMCKTPAKYAARMGQCFSTTVDTSFGGMESNGYRGLFFWKSGAKTLRVNDDLPDIQAYNAMTGAVMEHSDGVGLIQKKVLRNVLKQVHFGPMNKEDISAIQIRYGGAKGVLVAWDFDQLNSRLCDGYDVCLRPSMVKFKAPYDSLEVVNLAKPIPYYLNRNVILLGSSLGICDDKFIEMQAHHLSSLNKMLVDAQFASSFVPRLSGPDSGLMATLSHMLYAGMKPDKDPFLYSCLHATRSHHLMNLRKKARIHVEEGVVLIGGIDELGLVPENCVFLQIARPPIGQAGGAGQRCNDYVVVNGPVMVTKHPVMHPGDMRMLLAVDIPELSDKKNVILFSRHGERPEADKMSGSDLDGDQFAITWDTRLFLKSIQSPMDYSASKNPNESAISDDSLLQHFINHARNDNLGRISMLWMDHAIIKKDAGCQECLALAKLASIAVDFPKSGIPATIPKDLLLNSSTPRAHWRERNGSPSFHCESILGQLYDMVIDEMKNRDKMPHASSQAMAGRYRDNNGQILHLGDENRIFNCKRIIYNSGLAQLLRWKGDELDAQLIGYAEDQRYTYEIQLHELMNQYKIKSEGEVATGCILKYHKLHKRRRHDVSEEVRRQFRSICKTCRSEFSTAVYHLVNGNLSFFNPMSDSIDDEDIISDEKLEWIEASMTGASFNIAGEEQDRKAKTYSRRLAAAYYITTYHPDKHDMCSRSVFYSFPWVVAADVISFAVAESLG